MRNESNLVLLALRRSGHETQSGVFGYKTRQGFGTTYTQAGDLAVEESFRKGITTAREISRCLRGH